MNSSLQIGVLMLVIGLLIVHCYPHRNISSDECNSSSDCGLGECCVVGMIRYSMPQCLLMGQVEAFCREDSEPENRTLQYPNGLEIVVFDVYTHVCPCDSGLQCIANTCSQDDNYDNNYLY